MKSLLTLFAIGLFSVCLAACGSTSKSTGSTAQASSTTATTGASATTAVSTTPTDTAPAPAETKADADKDNDVSASDDDKNNSSTQDFGHAASPSDARMITALIKRYYAAAAVEDGTKACSMIYSTIEESVPEDYGQSPPGQPYMRGTTCPAVLTLLFKHFHPQITVELPKLKVARVRLVEHHGVVVLNFGTMPEREISVAREGHTWKVDALLDGEVP